MHSPYFLYYTQFGAEGVRFTVVVMCKEIVVMGLFNHNSCLLLESHAFKEVS